ncbi:Tripartite tricarboxylate transporter TctB family protein [compost metagenome]
MMNILVFVPCWLLLGCFDMAWSRQVSPAQLAIGAGLIAICLILAVGAFRFPPERGFVILGAYVYPYAVSLFLGSVGLLLCRQAAFGGFQELPGGSDKTRQALSGGKAGAAWVTGGLVSIALLINIIGFVLAAALLFVCSARGFGSGRPVRGVAIGIALALPSYWLFNAGLGVSLPPLINAWI